MLWLILDREKNIQIRLIKPGYFLASNFCSRANCNQRWRYTLSDMNKATAVPKSNSTGSNRKLLEDYKSKT